MASFTPSQQSAIKCRSKTVLVSAAAGSGKTTTLTERIIRRLTDPNENADISRFLIVTFTKAAAADLRAKISAALGASLAENPASRHLSSQMIKLGSAKISTMDSFYLDVVRSNFELLGLPAKLSMMDPGELKILKSRVMDEVIDSFYEKKTPLFREFMDCFISSRGVINASAELIGIYEKLSGYPDFLEFLPKNAEALRIEAKKPFFETETGAELSTIFGEFLTHGINVYSDFLELILADEDLAKAYGPSFAYELEFYRRLSALLANGNYGEIRNALGNYSPIRLGTLKKDAKYKAEDSSVIYAKEERKKLVAKLRSGFAEKYFCFTEEQICTDMERTADFCCTLYSLLTEFDLRMAKEKLAKSSADFTDNKRFTFKLFIGEDGKPTDIAREYSRKFDEIYIDEYQDTDSVQDMIFSAISRPDNRFMVGDIKQSIYRFRGANPSVFTSYKNSFKGYEEDSGEDSCAIYMSENFRCDLPVIRVTNGICGYLFKNGPNSIGYTDKDDLVFGKRVDGEREMKRVRLMAVVSEEDSDALEMKAVISEIIRLTESENELCESRSGTRRIGYGDIAILTRDNKTADRYADALSKYGIPSSARTEVNYFENPEVLLMMSLLNVIDNPQKDVYLAGVLHSPLFGFNIDELIALRQCGSGAISLFDDLLCAHLGTKDESLRDKISYFLEKLELYRSRAALIGTDELIRFIYSDTSMLSFASGGKGNEDENLSMRRANLLLLYDYARRYEAGSYKGLYSFINYINDIIASEQTIEPPAPSDEGGRVQVMTIHNSKGLEFPVCFIVSTAKKGKSDTGVIQFDSKLGIGAVFGDESGFLKYDNIIRQMIIAKNSREELEEQMRVLYVAMTRARERLYISAARKDSSWIDSAKNRARASDVYSIMSCSNYFDWITGAYFAMPEDIRELIDLCELHDEDIKEPCARVEKADTVPSEASKAEVARLSELLEERFGFEYPYSHLTKLPAKMSVSKLFPGVLDSDEGEELFGDEITISACPAFLIPKEERATGADRGTATHSFMQFCDFALAERDAKKEMERLCEKGFIAKEMAELVDLRQIERFFLSDFYAEIKRITANGGRLYREQRFNIAMPASLFTENDEFRSRIEDELIAVQGVIDLVAVDSEGGIILCDYKTDALTSFELSDASLAASKLSARHSEQLSYYSIAVEKLFGRAPERVCIYSLPFGEALDIPIKKFQ